MWGFPGVSVVNNPACQCRRCKRYGFNPWVGKIPGRRKRQPTLVLLPGEFHGQRSLAGYSPWGHKESDMTEQLTQHIQYSCLENSMDRGAWRATVHGVTKSWPWLSHWALMDHMMVICNCLYMSLSPASGQWFSIFLYLHTIHKYNQVLSLYILLKAVWVEGGEEGGGSKPPGEYTARKLKISRHRKFLDSRIF